MINKRNKRKLKNIFSSRGSSNGFVFKRSKARDRRIKRTQTEYSWNSTTFFIVISILAVMTYAVVQLGIAVHLDEQSKTLQTLRQEEQFLAEENQNLESKITRQQSKVRVVQIAEEDLEMRQYNENDIVYISDFDLSAEVIGN